MKIKPPLIFLCTFLSLCLTSSAEPSHSSHTTSQHTTTHGTSHASQHNTAHSSSKKLKRLRKALEEENHLKAELYLAELEKDINKAAEEERIVDDDLNLDVGVEYRSKLDDVVVGKKHKKSSEKKELLRLRKEVSDYKVHQAREIEKLMAVKQGVAALVKSLNGTKMHLNQAKKESSDMESELKNLHKQAAAAAKLQREISEIQHHARVNYETGELELKGTDFANVNRRSIDHLSQQTKMMDESERPANLADPAVLHADLILLLDIVLLLFSATFGGILAALCNMPPIIGYILGGTVVGPSGMDIIRTVIEVDTLAQFGSVFFLFAHGLEFSINDLRKFQTVSFGGCILATILSTVFIQVYSLGSGLVSSPLEGGLLGLSASLSSLSVVLAYLQENKLLQSTHGKVMVGYLTCQGLMMGLVFSIPPALSTGSISVGIALLRAFVGGITVVFLAYVLSNKGIPLLLGFLEKSRRDSNELYLLGVVSLAMVMALLTEFLGLSLDLGAFFAGLMLAGTPYMERTAIAIQPLASVFAAMLFASIGMIINPVFFWNHVGEILLLVFQIVIVKIVVITIVVRLFNYSWRDSIVSGIGLSNIGEFSLLFSSKLQTHALLSRRAYLIFLAATVTTLLLAPLALRMLNLVPLKERD